MSKVKEGGAKDSRRIAVYARKSKVTESGKSIEIQKEKCIALAIAQFGALKSDILVYEDEGKSGFYADRPQYIKMLRDIEDNKIKAVICYKIDRISRRTVDLLNLVRQMECKGIDFVSVSDRELDTSTRTGKIMISLLSAIAEFERDIIAERITDNMYELAKEGRWLGGECPLGYVSKRERRTISGRKTSANYLEPLEEEQKTVKRLFEVFLRTRSFTGSAEVLNKEGLKTKKGRDFTLTAIKNILQNPVYAAADSDMLRYFKSINAPVWASDSDFDGKHGVMAYNKTEQKKEPDTQSRTLDPKYRQRNLRRDIKEWVIAVGRHKGIVSGADWIKAQCLIAEISKNCSARPKDVSKSLLSGLLLCSECAGKMIVRAESGRYNQDGTPRFRYICGAKYRKKGGCENAPDIKGFEIDDCVFKVVCGMEIWGNAFMRELPQTKRAVMSIFRDEEKELNKLKKRLYQIEREKHNQAANLRTAPINVRQAVYEDIELLNTEHTKTRLMIEAINEKMCKHKSEQPVIENAARELSDFGALIKSAGYEAKCQLLREILESVVVEGGIAHIFMKGASKALHNSFDK